MYVATIVCSREKRNLNEALVNIPNTSQVQIIEPGIAADVFYDKGKVKPGDFDVIAQPVEARKKKLLVCDMESTIIENEFLDEIAELGSPMAEVYAVITG